MKSHSRAVMTVSVVFALCAGAGTASAQSLGEIARQEEARRKAITAPVKAYTNNSLAPVAGETIPTPPDPAPATAKPAPAPLQAVGTPAAPADQESPKTQDYWKKRIGDARDQRDRNRVYLDALQSRINALTSDFAARDDPAQRTQIAAERQRAVSELERLTKQQQDLEKQIGAIEDEARRAGIPAGWLR
ncbi:MAG: hypothetical protein WCP29_09660 [Acidobacteriota bacterium]